MKFTKGKYRLRNGVVVDITYRHHGWGLSTQACIPELGDDKVVWHTWVIMDRKGRYKGEYAVLEVWDNNEVPIREFYTGKPLPQARSAYDILEKL